MSWAAFFITIVYISTYCAAQITLTQSPSESVSPGSTVKIPCTASGITISDRYVSWYQQKEGNSPRYLLYYYDDSDKHQGTGVPDRFSGSKDNSKNAGYLTIRGALTEDEADYYCAVWDSNAYIFGGGTTLSVHSGDVKTPSVFMYKPSDEELKTDKATVVCTLSAFTPKIASVEWMVDEKKWTTDIYTTPASKQADNLYMESSLLSMSSTEYMKHEKFACKVTHQGKEIIQTINRSECS
ncbi:pre-B lymphocyte protein 3 [Bufo bufo]|uniref:pre-B lymphocyte protein 3 n=1 Tax=Bufo bufo TaxID=8384 RepID=UPI001ABED213|nr:pre-B lymphocyte protein 3 [Bufo bufo]